MNVLVTGGTGYIGLNLIHTLIDSSHNVSVFARETSPTKWLPEDVSTYIGDVTNEADVRSAVEQSDCNRIVHLAAVHGRYSSAETEGSLDEATGNAVNVKGTANVIKAANESSVTSVVFLSTTKAHPKISADNPSVYVQTKVAAQDLFHEQKQDFQYAIVNPTVVVGPRDYRLARYQIYQLVISNRLLVPPLYKPIRINLIHIQDVVDTILHFLSDPNGEDNLVTGKNVRMRQYCKTIARVSDSSTWIPPTPYAHLYIPRMIDLVNQLGLIPIDSKMFSWSDRTVPDKYTKKGPIKNKSLRTIVRDTYDWYTKHELL